MVGFDTDTVPYPREPRDFLTFVITCMKSVLNGSFFRILLDELFIFSRPKQNRLGESLEHLRIFP
jgi:hypothetical protein